LQLRKLLHGADEILVSDPSEPGPIDLQITLSDAHGKASPHSIQSYLDAFKSHSEVLRLKPNDPVPSDLADTESNGVAAAQTEPRRLMD
jgi:hypothetical protein